MKNSITIALACSILLIGLGSIIISLVYPNETKPETQTVLPEGMTREDYYGNYKKFIDTSGYYDTVIFTEEDSILSTY